MTKNYIATLQHNRLMEFLGTHRASDYPSWDKSTGSPFMRGGDGIGYGIWLKCSAIPYMLLLSGALPSELV